MSRDLTPTEAVDAARAFCAEAGPEAKVSLFLQSSKHAKEPLILYFRPRGYQPNGKDEGFSVHGSTFREVLDAARTKWAEMSVEYAKRTVRKMALDIIRITADIGACSDGALRQAGFSQLEIDKYGEQACADANEIAANGPFEIATVGRANEAA